MTYNKNKTLYVIQRKELTMKTIKWGVIGTGRIARAFTEALAGTPDTELYAVGSRTAEKAVAFAANYGFTKWFGSYEELLSDKDVDVVYVATTMNSHYENCMLALEHGKNVLCEKSVTINAQQLRDILALAEKKGLFFMEAMWMKCRPAYIRMLEWIKSGAIGDIRYIKADFSNHVRYDADDRLFRADCGGGALLDECVYPLTLVYDILGKPDDILAAAHIDKNGIDLSESVILRYKGAYASVDSGFEVALKNNAVIAGDKGSVMLGDWFFVTNNATLYDAEGNIVEECSVSEKINGYEYEVEEVNRCIREGLKESPLVPQSGTLAVMEIMDEISAIIRR